MPFFTIYHLLSQDKHLTKWRVLFWLNSGLLLYLTLMPSVAPKIPVSNIDKLFHLIGFAAFAFLCRLAYPKLRLFWVFVWSSTLGILVEVIQSQLPYRSFSLADMLADILGVLLVIIFLQLAEQKSNL